MLYVREVFDKAIEFKWLLANLQYIFLKCKILCIFLLDDVESVCVESQESSEIREIKAFREIKEIRAIREIGLISLISLISLIGLIRPLTSNH